MRGPVRSGGPSAVLVALALVAPLVALGVFHVWSRSRVLAAGYELGRLESEHRQLLAERDRLNLEVATLRSPGRLERFARERLGMAPPAPGAVRAAGPRLALAGGGVGKDGDGVDHRSGPAEPARSRAPAAVDAGGASTKAPATRVALRGPLVAGRAPRAE